RGRRDVGVAVGEQGADMGGHRGQPQRGQEAVEPDMLGRRAPEARAQADAPGRGEGEADEGDHGAGPCDVPEHHDAHTSLHAGVASTQPSVITIAGSASCTISWGRSASTLARTSAATTSSATTVACAGAPG